MVELNNCIKRVSEFQKHWTTSVAAINMNAITTVWSFQWRLIREAKGVGWGHQTSIFKCFKELSSLTSANCQSRFVRWPWVGPLWLVGGGLLMKTSTGFTSKGGDSKSTTFISTPLFFFRHTHTHPMWGICRLYGFSVHWPGDSARPSRRPRKWKEWRPLISVRWAPPLCGGTGLACSSGTRVDGARPVLVSV